MSIRSYRTQLLYALIGGASILALGIRTRQVRRERLQPLGCLTAQQVLARSTPICRALAPQVVTQFLTVEPSKGVYGSWWSVICRSREGNEIATLTWDARTGELYKAGAWASAPNRAQPLNRREAAGKSWEWMASLGIAAQARRWHLAGVTQSPDLKNWFIRWTAAGRRADMMLDAHSGDLLLLENWRH